MYFAIMLTVVFVVDSTLRAQDTNQLAKLGVRYLLSVTL